MAGISSLAKRITIIIGASDMLHSFMQPLLQYIYDWRFNLN